MRKANLLFLVPMLFLLFGSVSARSQETPQASPITVKSRQTYKGLVVLNILKAGKAFELSCNEGLAHCNSVQPGKYVMVQLPKNRGMYECDNVELYPEGTEEPTPEKRLGSYCMNEK